VAVGSAAAAGVLCVGTLTPPPVDSIVPATVSREPGVAVPMPTLPPTRTRSASTLLVRTTSGWLSVVPRKLMLGLVLLFPVMDQSVIELAALANQAEAGARISATTTRRPPAPARP